MPELPEVEAARVLVQEQCGGQRIQGVHAEERGGGPRTGQFDDIIFDDPGGSAEHVSQALTGKSLVQVKRRGKQLLLMLSSPPHLLAHFGMTGSFTVRGVEPLKYQKFKVDDAAWPPRFTKFEIVFEQAALAFTDPRRLGRLRLRSDPLNEEPWRSLAADPLLDTIERSQWTETIWSKGCAIKALLLDQAALVSGVGNWVADEVLFHSGIHPEAACHTLSAAQAERLLSTLVHIIHVAVKAGADAQEFPPDWLFHYRWGKGAQSGGSAPRVPGPKGGPISFLTVGGRTSAVVLTQQRKGERRVDADGESVAPAKKASKGKGNKRSRKGAEEAASEAAGEAAGEAGVTEAAPAAASKAKRAATVKRQAQAMEPAEGPTDTHEGRKLEERMVAEWQATRGAKRGRQQGRPQPSPATDGPLQKSRRSSRVVASDA